MLRILLLVSFIFILGMKVSRGEYVHYSIRDNLCPRGYWLANVRKNEHTGTQTFEIKDLEVKADVCRYCENISCFIFKHPHRSTKKIGDEIEVEEDTGVTENLMTCKHNDNLPHPSLIVTFLDCVQMGFEDLFHLMLYLPDGAELHEPVEFIDPEFLEWIEVSRKKLLSLELGFPMRKLPQLFINHYTTILTNATQICFDASHLRRFEPKFDDLSTPNKSDINRRYIFRKDGLSKSRPPPDNYELIDCVNNQVEGKSCLIEFNNLRSALKGVTKDLLTDRLRINETIFRAYNYKMNSSDSYYYKLSSMLLLLLVLVFTFGSILIFCINNRDKYQFCRGRKKKLDADFHNDPIEEMNRRMKVDENMFPQQYLYQRPDMQDEEEADYETYNGMMNNQMIASNPRMMMSGQYNIQR